MAEKRKRNWAFVLYPESAPEGWQEMLRDMLVPGYISPLHDSDTNADGEPKKAHHHVILTFKGLKSYEQVLEITSKLNATVPQECKDVRAYARYLCHLDNPEKAQYEPGDVVCLGGADYLDKVKSAADTDVALGEMMDWCVEQGCYSFFRLSMYARQYKPDWFRVLSSQRTVFLTSWLKSMEWEVRHGEDIESLCTFRDTEVPEGHESTTRDTTRDTRDTTRDTEKVCPECGSVDFKKKGKTASDQQRYQCRECGKTFL